MQYLGGKYRVAPKFKPVINEIVPGDLPIWDAFCGGLGFAEAFPERDLLCTDVNPWLINLYTAWGAGWRPPEGLNKGIYNEYKRTKPENDPLTAFLGFGCSFAGKWFAGWAANKKGTDYAAQCVRALDRAFTRERQIAFARLNFLEESSTIPIVYCDPPYKGTKGYAAAAGFDHVKFWKRCALLVERGQHVFVSEQIAPPDWGCVWEKDRKSTTDIGVSKKLVTERLFYRGPASKVLYI